MVFSTNSSRFSAWISVSLKGKHRLRDGMSLLSAYWVVDDAAIFLSLSLLTDIITWATKKAMRQAARSLPPHSACVAISKNDKERVCRCRCTGLRYNAIPRLPECWRQVEEEVVSNSRNKIHQTWVRPYSKALYLHDAQCNSRDCQAGSPNALDILEGNTVSNIFKITNDRTAISE